MSLEGVPETPERTLAGGKEVEEGELEEVGVFDQY